MPNFDWKPGGVPSLGTAFPEAKVPKNGVSVAAALGIVIIAWGMHTSYLSTWTLRIHVVRANLGTQHQGQTAVSGRRSRRWLIIRMACPAETSGH